MVDFKRISAKPEGSQPLSWKAITEFVGAVTFTLRDELTAVFVGREEAQQQEFSRMVALANQNLARLFEERLQQFQSEMDERIQHVEARHAREMAELRASVRDGSVHS